jgi:hypothetical protein
MITCSPYIPNFFTFPSHLHLTLNKNINDLRYLKKTLRPHDLYSLKLKLPK